MIKRMFTLTSLLSALLFMIAPLSSTYAQSPDSGRALPANATLSDLIAFALENQGRIQQAVIDEEIGEREIASALSGWYPQISANANYNRNIEIPTTVIGDQVISMGQRNASALVL